MHENDAEHTGLAMSVARHILPGTEAPPSSPFLVIDRPHPFPSQDTADDGPAPLIPRGIWVTPWFYRGHRWVFAVDSTGSVIHLESVTELGDRDAQVQSLRVMLAALDPARLALVGD